MRIVGEEREGLYERTEADRRSLGRGMIWLQAEEKGDSWLRRQYEYMTDRSDSQRVGVG